MTESERKTIKKWIDVWQETGKALQELKIQELRADDYYEKNKRLLNEMLQYAYEHRTVRLTSGLVEQQRYFMKLRKNMNEANKSEKINALFQAALEFQNTFEEQNWSFCCIGGLAVIRWGHIRINLVVDFCLLCGFGSEENYIKPLLKKFESRISDAHQFALKRRVLLLYASNGVSVDISLSGLPFEEEMIKRATLFEFEKNCSLITCSAEDLLVLKAFADRPKDWMDVESVIMRQGNKLDRNFVIEQLTPLCELKETPEIVDKLKKLF